jgi:hypothetical protein
MKSQLLLAPEVAGRVRREINPSFEISAFFVAAVMPAEISLIPDGFKHMPRVATSRPFLSLPFLLDEQKKGENMGLQGLT